MAKLHRNETRPPISFLRECVSYCQESGALTWRERPRSHFVRDDRWLTWNKLFAGQPVKKRSGGYVVVTVTYEARVFTCLGHRVAYAFVTGAWPEDEIDHWDLNKANNAWANLRPASHSENACNTRMRRTCKSGFKGVYRHTQHGNWVAQIQIDGKRRHIGCFATPEQASAAYKAASIAHQGQFTGAFQ